MKSPPPRSVLPALLLGLIVLAALFLRVWHNDYGLPFVYSIDESSHFTDRAVDMFREGIDPGYYQNPTAYTYLVYGLLRLMYGPLQPIFHLDFGNVTDQFAQDPTAIWTAARSLAAVLGVLGVLAVWWAARRLWGVREGLVAAAVMAFAFLPVAYGRVAVTDVGTLVGVALALWLAVRAYEARRLRDYAFAGAAAGLALSFKYTAGLALLPLGLAALLRLRQDRFKAVLGLVAGVALAGVVFLILDPYVVGSFDDWWRDLRGQANVAADEPKPGQQSGGLSYYLDSLTWGLGWLACAAAVAGAAIELRRDVGRALLLLALPVALLVYLSVQSRYFGRWLLPAYPALAMLAGVAIVRAGDALAGVLARRRARAAEASAGSVRPRAGVLAGIAIAVLTAIVLAQPLAADVRSGIVLGREDTREQALDFLVDRYPPELRISIEPSVPGRFYRSNPEGRTPSWLSRCDQRPGWTEPGWSYVSQGGKRVCQRFKPGLFVRPDGGVRASAYHMVLTPAVIDDYRRYGYCLVMTTGTVRDRALETGRPQVRAYYDRLERESTLLRHFSPYKQGADPVPFNFDLSYNYYPSAYERPGPDVRIYRLDDCRQGVGPPLIRIPKARELPPFAPRDPHESLSEDAA